MAGDVIFRLIKTAPTLFWMESGGFLDGFNQDPSPGKSRSDSEREIAMSITIAAAGSKLETDVPWSTVKAHGLDKIHATVLDDFKANGDNDKFMGRWYRSLKWGHTSHERFCLAMAYTDAYVLGHGIQWLGKDHSLMLDKVNELLDGAKVATDFFNKYAKPVTAGIAMANTAFQVGFVLAAGSNAFTYAKEAAVAVKNYVTVKAQDLYALIQRVGWKAVMLAIGVTGLAVAVVKMFGKAVVEFFTTQLQKLDRIGGWYVTGGSVARHITRTLDETVTVAPAAPVSETVSS